MYTINSKGSERMNKYIVITTINEAIQKPKVFNTHKEATEHIKKRIEKKNGWTLSPVY